MVLNAETVRNLEIFNNATDSSTTGTTWCILMFISGNWIRVLYTQRDRSYQDVAFVRSNTVCLRM